MLFTLPSSSKPKIYNTIYFAFDSSRTCGIS